VIGWPVGSLAKTRQDLPQVSDLAMEKESVAYSCVHTGLNEVQGISIVDLLCSY
jgi:hypothetical protein